MTRHKEPREKDRQKLELLLRYLNGIEETITCGCEAENEACSYCGIEIEPEDFGFAVIDYNSLQATLRYKDIHPESDLARKYNLGIEHGNNIPDIVDLFIEEAETLEDLHDFINIARLLEEVETADIGDDELVNVSRPIQRMR